MYNKAFYERNKEKAIARTKEWRAKNKERKKENDRKWKLKNSDKVVMSREKFRKSNPIAQRSSNLKKYGLTIDQYNQLFVDQNGVCAICGSQQTIGTNLYVDHDHETGKVRGLLCHNCNFGLGQLKDSKDILLKAIEYLNKFDV